MIAQEIETVRLGDVTEFINGGAWNQSEYSDSGIPVVRVSDIKGGTVDLSGCKYLPASALEKYSKNQLKEGDLVICTVGSHPTQPGSVVGRAGIIPKKANGALLNQNAVCIRPNDENVDKTWLGYIGKSKEFHDYIKAHARGAASQVRMAIGLLKDMNIPLPDLPTQKKIAGILSAYDDLIENNLRRIQILEEMAQSLYREWFVHFRFPGHESTKFKDSPLGPIPEDWEVKKLGEIAEDLRRGIPKGPLQNKSPYVGLEHIPRKSLALDNWETVSELGSNKLRFKPGDILFGKIRPYFHKVSIAPFEGICSADTIVINSISPEDLAIVTACVSSEHFVAHATATSNGSKMPRANWKVLVDYQLAYPPKDLLQLFTSFFEKATQEQQNLIKRNQNLRKTRDLLLPKLLSGGKLS